MRLVEKELSTTKRKQNWTKTLDAQEQSWNRLWCALKEKPSQNVALCPKNQTETPQNAAMLSKLSYGQLKWHNPWRTRGNRWKNEAWEGYLKRHPDEPVDRSWFDRPPGQWSTLWFLCIFPSRDPPPALLRGNPLFFMSNAKGILIFGQNLSIFLSICLYDAYDMKFMQS